MNPGLVRLDALPEVLRTRWLEFDLELGLVASEVELNLTWDWPRREA